MNVAGVELRGCYPILATPFRPDGEIDEESVVRLVRHLHAAGLPGFTMFGLASEFYKLGDADREALIEAAFDARAQDQTTIVSVTAHSLEVATKQARRAEEAGADALMV
ncbi:MAG: dihydrodipicolinate synthase family protein, partial [Rubrobacter sp.]